MSSLTVEEEQRWVPTHVQVTVLRGRGLRGKGKHGTSDVYTIIQLGKEKYSTCVAEKTTEPEWKEECTFELQPGVLESGSPAGSNELVLTAMHRALIGLDVFLGQALIKLDKLYHEGRSVKNEWYRLNSKTGKKEKERGDIQVTVQFTRNNLTASMYDLVMKDKGAFTFSKLKERMRGKRRPSEEDSSSAILPGGYGSLCRMRQRLPSDGGGEEDYEDDEGGEVRRSKMRTFFLRGKLRKSSDTRSSTSLGSESSESSSRGGSLSPTAGISVVVSDLSNSPSNSSNLTADNSPEHTANMSPKSSSSLQCEFGDEAGEITIAVPQPVVCVNGSHAYSVQPLDPGSGKPPQSFGLGLKQKTLPLSTSLQNLSLRASTELPKGPVGDGRRWSFDKPDEEDKAAITAALEKSGPMVAEEDDEQSPEAAPTKAAYSATAEMECQGKKQKKNVFSSGRSDSAGRSQAKNESEQAAAASEERHKGWFGSKDSHSKPSLLVSPKVEPGTPLHQPPLPPVNHPPGSPLVPPLHHTNPFCHSQSTPPPITRCNPFFSLLQHNPFYEDMLSAQHLKPALPPLPFLSSSRPPIAHLFPQCSNTNMGRNGPITPGRNGTRAEREREPQISKRPSNPFVSAGGLRQDLEWDESFEAFAAGRLQSTEDLTTGCKTQQNTTGDNPLQRRNSNTALPPKADESPHRQTCTTFAHRVTSQVAHASTCHVDAFSQYLETIPESDVSLNTTADSQELAACAVTNQTHSSTNTSYLTNTNGDEGSHHTAVVKLNSSSPDPSSSGLGSSVEEDFLSCPSSYSDKFSASSSEEAEVQNFEKDVLSFEKSSEAVKNFKPSGSEDDITDGSHDLSLANMEQPTVVTPRDDDGKVDVGILEGPLALQLTALPSRQPVIAAGEPPALELLGSQPTCDVSLHSYKENGEEEEKLGIPLEDDSSVSQSTSTDLVMALTPYDELCSIPPSVHIITSSPDVKQSPADSLATGTPSGGHDTSRRSPVPFELFVELPSASRSADGPSRCFDDMLLHTGAYDQSSGSFLQSFYVSTDSQDYQTCTSLTSPEYSSGSETPNETLHSANSTLCGDLSDVQTSAGAASVQATNEEIFQTNQSEVPNNSAAILQSSTVEDDLGLDGGPAASADLSCIPRKLSDGGLANRPDAPSCPQAHLLHRCQSEGTLVPAFDEPLLPSIESDPGATQDEESSASDLPSLTPLPLPLTPDGSSSHVALCPLPPSDNATARSPLGTAPKPLPQESQQQQAANQQNSPHPVKPLTATILAEEKRTEGRSVLATGLEKLRSTINPGRSSQPGEQEADKKKIVTEGAGSYYHLNHSELVALLVQREAELERQKEEFERQKCLLAKRELELKKLKPQVRDLEDYIDTLLVRIMEQKPTLLQVRSKLK